MNTIEIPNAPGTTRHIKFVYIDMAKPQYVEIGLEHVRAADSIRVSYDFARDGWKIEQASVFEWDCDDTECDRGWVEVGFCKAWQFEGKARA